MTNLTHVPSEEPTERDMYDSYLEEYPVDTDIPLSLAEWRQQVQR